MKKQKTSNTDEGHSQFREDYIVKDHGNKFINGKIRSIPKKKMYHVCKIIFKQSGKFFRLLF